MKRFALSLAAGTAAISGSMSAWRLRTIGVVDVYGGLATMCMRLSDAVRAHTDAVATAAVAGLALLAVASVVMQVLRTTAMVKSLASRRLHVLPVRVGALARSLDLQSRVDVVSSEEMLAFCHGIRRPRLILSTALVEAMADDELEAVLRHEAAHLYGSDPLRIMVAQALGRAFIFLPIAPAVVDAYTCRRELAADRETVSAMGDVVPLASALQRMLASTSQVRLAGLAVGPLSPTDVRIDQLLGHHVSSRALFANVNRFHAIVFAFVAAALTCILISTAHAMTGVRPCVPC